MEEHEARKGAPSGGPEGEDTLDMDVAEFAGTMPVEGSEAGLAGGEGDLGAGGDVAGDFGGLDPEGDEGAPA